MKKIYNILLIIMIALAYSCSNNNIKNSFVYLKKDSFYLGNKKFFPLFINYGFDLARFDGKLILVPLNENSREDTTVLKKVKAHFKLIKELGFNSLRIYGTDRLIYRNDSAFIEFFNEKGAREQMHILSNMESYFEALDNVVNAAKETGLKIMLLIGDNVNESREREKFLTEILKHYKNEPTIFAYDFFNEPLYFDKVKERKKQDALRLVKKWRKLKDEYAPYQLMTIGFSEPIEVFEWDAEVLPVDFLAFHVYDPLRIPNEIYWYSHYIHKPWVIGETGLAADNDSVSYERQKEFIKQTFQYAINCGAKGFGIWQFQDVSWSMWKANYKGLLTKEGVTIVNGIPIKGQLKPSANVIKELWNIKPTGKCKRPGNYYNMRDYHKYLVTGKVISAETGKPIEGAVIRGWTEDWKWGTNTYTDSTGTFYLYSDWEFVHYRISAPTYDRIKFVFHGNYEITEAGKHPEQYPDSLQRRIRNYTGTVFYNYKPEDYYYAFRIADMGIKKLKKLKIVDEKN